MLKWELFEEEKEVVFNPVTISNIDGADKAIETLTDYSRNSKVIEKEYIGMDGEKIKGYFIETRLKDTIEALYLIAKLLQFKCASNPVSFFDRLGVEGESGLLNLLSMNAVCSLLMMKFSDFAFTSLAYKPIFEAIGDQTLTFQNAQEILLTNSAEILSKTNPPKVENFKKEKKKKVKKTIPVRKGKEYWGSFNSENNY